MFRVFRGSPPGPGPGDQDHWRQLHGGVQVRRLGAGLRAGVARELRPSDRCTFAPASTSGLCACRQGVFGGTVNFAAGVVGAVKDAEIWLSERAKEDIDRLGAGKHMGLKWKRHEGVAMK